MTDLLREAFHTSAGTGLVTLLKGDMTVMVILIKTGHYHGSACHLMHAKGQTGNRGVAKREQVKLERGRESK